MMLGNMVLEIGSAPSNNLTFNLTGAVTGSSTFRSQMASGTSVYYVMRDTTHWETGVGTLTHGTPDTLSRTTVLANSSGNTSRITFAGDVYAYSHIPAEKAVHLGDFTQSLASSGYTFMPGGLLLQWGGFGGTTGSLVDGVAETGSISVTFPVAFPTACYRVFGNADDVSGAALQEIWYVNTAPTTTGFTARLSCKQASTAMTGSYWAIGK